MNLLKIDAKIMLLKSGVQLESIDFGLELKHFYYLALFWQLCCPKNDNLVKKSRFVRFKIPKRERNFLKSKRS